MMEMSVIDAPASSRAQLCSTPYVINVIPVLFQQFQHQPATFNAADVDGAETVKAIFLHVKSLNKKKQTLL